MGDGPILDGLRRAAERAGMIDPEDVRMTDISRIRLNADGDLMIPSGFFETLRRDKPHLFSGGQDVRGMSPAEYRKARAAYVQKASERGPAYAPPEGFDARIAPRAEVERVEREYVRHEAGRELRAFPGRTGPR